MSEIQTVEDRGTVPRRPNSALNGLRALGYFDGRLRKAIHALKYSGRRPVAKPLAQLLARYLENNPLPYEVIMPVPLHLKRTRERGYNQAEILAQELGNLTSKKVDVQSLIRHRLTPAQVGLSEEERLTNVRGAFQVLGEGLQGKAVLLVDDVATTGATLEACAHALRAGGASKVWGFVLAKER
ncbi:MAG: ComF family protein [Chloroflexi bacterium]|nr:ComF family protein [Chloroflexota bacterium]